MLAPVAAARVLPAHAEVVEAQAADADGLRRSAPRGVQRRSPHRRGARGREQQTIRTEGHRREMLLEVGDDHLRDHDRPHPGIGLGRAEHERAIAELLILLLDPNRAMQQIEVPHPQAPDLAEAQSAAPSSGRMCNRNSPSYSSRVRGLSCGRSASQRDEYSSNVTLPASGSIHDPRLTSERTGSEVRVGLALGAKRRRRAAPHEIDAVARLEPARRQLAHASPRAATHADKPNSVVARKWHDMARRPISRAVLGGRTGSELVFQWSG